MSAIVDQLVSLISDHQPGEVIYHRLHYIHQHVLSNSRTLIEPNFTRIHTSDLALLFDAYDLRFFQGLCRPALGGRRLTFRLASRLTRSGGVTKRIQWRNGDVSYEIAVATSILFEGFGAGDRAITVCGLECANRLEALQRIFEHELVHLLELLCWNHSRCSAPRFQDIARRFFLHRAHTHHLITRRERAADAGVRPGAQVSFVFEGRRLTGRVNRVTRRATVLVEQADGRRYSDGCRYQAYYVPVSQLEPYPPSDV